MSKLAVLRLIDPEIENEEAMAPHEVNSLTQKVDRIVYLLEGEDAIPGLVKRVAALEEILLGQKGKDGLVHQVSTIWRLHIWLLCTASGCAGYVLNIMITKFIH